MAGIGGWFKKFSIGKSFQDAGGPVLFGFFPFSPRNVTVITVIPDHLLPPVRDVGAHGGQPLQGIEDLFLFFFSNEYAIIPSGEILCN